MAARLPQYGIILGRVGRDFLTLPTDEHVCLHARSGAGKSSSFSLPCCFSWPSSLVVLDIKSEAFEATAGYRAEVLKQEVYRFDPASDTEQSHRWDPFASVDRASIDRFDQISRIGSQLFAEPHAGPGGGNADQFWIPAGRMAFNAVAGLICETPGESLTMADVLRAFTRTDSVGRLTRSVSDALRNGRPYSRIVSDGIGDYCSGDPRQVDGIRKTCSTHLQPWFNPRVIAATSASDFDLRDIRRRPMTIYLTVTPRDLPRLLPLIRLFFDQLLNLNTGSTPEEDSSVRYPVLLLMDEFSRIGKVESIAHAVQFARGYGIRLAFVVQNRAQIREVYGVHATADLFGNLGAEIIFGAGDLEVSRELEQRLGTDTVPARSVSRPRFIPWLRTAKQGVSDHPHGRPLLLSQEILSMPPDDEIVLRPGMPPVKATKIKWWRDPAFRNLVRKPPETPKLDIVIDYDTDAVPLLRPARSTSGFTQEDIDAVR